MLNFFRKKVRLKTFTYYIPSPPVRKSGYQEKEFDRLFHELAQFGLELHQIHTQADPTVGGMWIILVYRCDDDESNKQFVDYLENIEAKRDSAQSGPQVEGLYYD